MMNKEINFRKINKNDDELVKNILKDKTITNNVPFHPKKSNLFLVDGKVIGFYNIESIHGYPEIQYAILKEYRNLNYGTILLGKLTNLIFQKNSSSRIYLMIHKENIFSLKAAKRNGYFIDEELQRLSFDADVDFPYYYFIKENPFIKKEKLKKVRKL